MKCEKLLKTLGDYVEGDIDPELCAEFEKHMKDCDACKVVVDNIRRTITIYKGEAVVELPPAFKKKLHEGLRAKWKRNG